MAEILTTGTIAVELSHSIAYEPGDGLTFIIGFGDPDTDETTTAVEFLFTEQFAGMVQTLREDGDYRTAYTVGHILTLMGEDLLELAETMEDGMDSVANVYDIDKEDLE